MGSKQLPSQGYPRSVTCIPFSFKLCLKGTFIYPPTSYRKHLLRDSDDPRFMFYDGLRIRIVRQGLSCVHSDDFGSLLLIWVSSHVSLPLEQRVQWFVTEGCPVSP